MSTEAHDRVATGETTVYEESEPPYKSPNRFARVLMVVGIVAIVAIINYFTNIHPVVPPPPPPPPPTPKLPYAAKEIVASKWLNTKDGKPIKLSELKGKIVLLEFWRSQCHSCETAIPLVKELERKFAKNNVHIVTIHTAVTEDEKDEQSVRKYVKEHNITVPVALDTDKTTLEKRYGYAVTTPTFLLINKKGNVIDYQPSSTAQLILEAEITAMLKGSDLEREAKIKNAPPSVPAPTPRVVPQPVMPDNPSLPGKSNPVNSLPPSPQKPQ